jgi:hypothetical protein
MKIIITDSSAFFCFLFYFPVMMVIQFGCLVSRYLQAVYELDRGADYICHDSALKTFSAVNKYHILVNAY